MSEMMMKMKISNMSNNQLVELRNHFDNLVTCPKNQQAEYSVLLALNRECQNRGIEW